MGNAVTSEETHGNAVVGAATASVAAQPPVDTVSNRKISMIFPLVSCCSCVNIPSSS